MRSAPVVSVVIVALIAACGGATTAALDAADASPDDAATGDGGCLVQEPAEGTACGPGQSVCSTGDACCVGYVWGCDATTHKWKKWGLGCACRLDAGHDAPAIPIDAGPFACGNVTCGGSQYCTDHPPGIRGPDGSTFPDAYNCDPLPAACSGNPTCACVVPTLGGSCQVASCSASGGHVTVTCLGQ